MKTIIPQVLAHFLMSVLSCSAFAQTDIGDPRLGMSEVRLWDGPAPDERGAGIDDRPALTMFRPQLGRANSAAVIVVPGGTYVGLSNNLEGRQIADWFTARGVTAFVLRYRLGRTYPMPIPLHDAQRAIRMVRARAAAFGVATDRIGLIGFSAGGHLSAMAATSFDAGQSDATDPIERASSRPDFLVLGYPAMSMFDARQTSKISYCRVAAIDTKCDRAYLARYSPGLHVSAQTPPTFIYHTTDDAVVPVGDSIGFFQALIQAGVPAEMHLFRHGPHGSGLGLGDPALDVWPTLLEHWLRNGGFISSGVPGN